MTATMSMSKVSRKYRPKILSLLNGIREEFRSEGYKTSEVIDISDDEHEWEFEGSFDSTETHDFNFTLSVAIRRSVFHDNSTPFGINFSLNATAEDGEILVGIIPFNYSDRVWVSRKDPQAVEERWSLFRELCESYDLATSIHNDLLKRVESQ